MPTVSAQKITQPHRNDFIPDETQPAPDDQASKQLLKENIEEVLKYRETAKNISDIDRTNQDKDIVGVQLKGIVVRNPATNEEMVHGR